MHPMQQQNQSHKTRRGSASPSDEPEITFRVYDRIEPGNYLAYCRSARYYQDRHYQRHVCLLLWDVIGPDGFTTIATVRCWFRLGSLKSKPQAKRTGKYWQWWVQANGGRSPRRKDRLTIRIFERRYARVIVADTKSEGGPYSVVSAVTEWKTGVGEDNPRAAFSSQSTELLRHSNTQSLNYSRGSSVTAGKK